MAFKADEGKMRTYTTPDGKVLYLDGAAIDRSKEAVKMPLLVVKK
jgi:hypothetical protein